MCVLAVSNETAYISSHRQGNGSSTDSHTLLSITGPTSTQRPHPQPVIRRWMPCQKRWRYICSLATHLNVDVVVTTLFTLGSWSRYGAHDIRLCPDSQTTFFCLFNTIKSSQRFLAKKTRTVTSPTFRIPHYALKRNSQTLRRLVRARHFSVAIWCADAWLCHSRKANSETVYSKLSHTD